MGSYFIIGFLTDVPFGMNRSDQENGRVVDTFDHSRALCAGTDNMNTTDYRMRKVSLCRQKWKQNCLVSCLKRLNIDGKKLD